MWITRWPILMWRLNSWEDYEIMGSTRCRRRRDRALETRNYAAFEAHTYERHGTISQTRDRRTRTRLLLAPIWNFTEHHGSRKKLEFCLSSEKLLWSWNFSLLLMLSTLMPCSKTRQGTKVNANTNHLKSWFAPFVVYAAAQILRERERCVRETRAWENLLSWVGWDDSRWISLRFTLHLLARLKKIWNPIDLKWNTDRRLPNTNTHNVMQTHR